MNQAGKKTVLFTGAGISTSAGIGLIPWSISSLMLDTGDYRGPFGKWTEQDLAIEAVPEECVPHPTSQRVHSLGGDLPQISDVGF